MRVSGGQNMGLRLGEVQPQTVLWSLVTQLDVRLSHDAVLLQGEGAREEGLLDTWGEEGDIKFKVLSSYAQQLQGRNGNDILLT